MEISERDVELVRKPVEWASALPREAYLSQEWYDQELDRIFSRSWIWVCTGDWLRNAGDFVTSKIGDDPIVIVRANDNKLHGLINVCRHRGAQVVKGEGNMKSFVCPYHNWTYGLDGGLRGTPGLDWTDMQGIEGFDSKKFGLHTFKVETWNGQVFANFDQNAERLESYLGEMGRVLKRFNLKNLKRANSIKFDLKVNWKIFGDNMCEEYHIPYLHRDTLYKGVEERVVKSHDNSVGFYVKNEPRKETSEPLIEGILKEDIQYMWFFYLFPGSLFFLTPRMFVAFNLIPSGVASCSVSLDYCFPDPAKVPEEAKKRSYDFVERILFAEDIPAQETVQSGLLSKKGWSQGDGRFSPRYEHGLHYFHNWVLDALQRS